MSVNGFSTDNVTHAQAVETLKRAGRSVVLVSFSIIVIIIDIIIVNRDILAYVLVCCMYVFSVCNVYNSVF